MQSGLPDRLDTFPEVRTNSTAIACTLPLVKFSDERKAGIRPPYRLDRSLLELIYTRLIEPTLPQLRPTIG